MSLIEIDTALIFAGYLGFSILYKSGSVDEIQTLVESVFPKPQRS